MTNCQAGKIKNYQQLKSRISLFLIRYKLLLQRSSLANELTSNEIRIQLGRIFFPPLSNSNFERSARGAIAIFRFFRNFMLATFAIMLIFTNEALAAYNCKNAYVSVFIVFQNCCCQQFCEFWKQSF